MTAPKKATERYSIEFDFVRDRDGRHYGWKYVTDGRNSEVIGERWFEPDE